MRELAEELGVKATRWEYIDSYEDNAVFEGTPIVIHAYYVEIEGEPTPASEIKEYAWIGADFEVQGFSVSSIMGKRVIPRLAELGYL